MGTSDVAAGYQLLYKLMAAGNFEVVNRNAGFEGDPDKSWIRDFSATFGNDQCFQYDGYINPQFSDDGAVPNETGSADPYATGDLLTQASAGPGPTSTGPGCIAGGTT